MTTRFKLVTLGVIVMLLLAVLSLFLRDFPSIESVEFPEDRGDHSTVAQSQGQRFPSIVGQGNEGPRSGSYPILARGADIPARTGYEMFIARFAMEGSSEQLAARMNVDQARATEISAEFKNFIETRTQRQKGFLRDTCNRRDSIRTVDELADELNEGLSFNEQSVNELLAVLLSNLTDDEAERLTYLAEEVRANAVSTRSDFRAYYRERGETGEVNLQDELSRICLDPVRVANE